MKYLKNFKLFEQKVLSAQELLSSIDETSLLKLEYPYDQLFGNISNNFKLFLHGGPGSGKTTFLLKFANDLTKQGNVLYVSSEEFGSVTLVKKLKEMVEREGHEFKLPENLFFSKEIGNLSDYQFVILDSVNDLGLDVEDFKKLKEKYFDTAFILVLQSTKSGDYRGGKDWEHEVDIAAKVKSGIIRVFKNRFDVYATYDFFNNQFIEETEE